MTSCTYWWWWNLLRKVVTARPAPAKANEMSTAAGTTSSAHHDGTSPSATMTPKKQVDATALRSMAAATSPTAMSVTPSGVARIES